MSTRFRIIITILVTLILSAAVGLLVINNLVSARFDVIETTIAKQTNSALLDILNNGLQSIATTASDWGAWDDTYQFVETPNQQYRDTNLFPGEFAVLQLNAIIIYDNNKKLVSYDSFDYKNNTELPADKELRELTAKLINALKFKTNTDVISGYIGEQSLFYFAAHPITPSVVTDNTVPIGTIIFVKQIFAQDAEAFGLISPPNVIVETANFKTLAGDARMNLSSANPIVYVTTSANIQAYSVVNDYFGSPLVYLHVNAERVFTTESRSLNNAIFLVMILVLSIFSAIFYFAIDRNLFKQLQRVSNFLTNLNSDPNTDSRLKENLGKDFEIFKTVLNSLLDKIRNEQIALKQVNERLVKTNEELLKNQGIMDAKNKELQHINELMVGRELKMIDLKRKLVETTGDAAGEQPNQQIQTDSAQPAADQGPVAEV